VCCLSRSRDFASGREFLSPTSTSWTRTTQNSQLILWAHRHTLWISQNSHWPQKTIICHNRMSTSSTMSSKSLPNREPSTPVRIAACTTRNGQCTHITMTRMYTQEFRCAICRRPGPMGWLYRCTQDSELLIEDDLENEDPVWVMKYPRSGLKHVLMRFYRPRLITWSPCYRRRRRRRRGVRLRALLAISRSLMRSAMKILRATHLSKSALFWNRELR
jgi:hypothetical protein